MSNAHSSFYYSVVFNSSHKKKIINSQGKGWEEAIKICIKWDVSTLTGTKE